jgi:hypothetical protein
MIIVIIYSMDFMFTDGSTGAAYDLMDFRNNVLFS